MLLSVRLTHLSICCYRCVWLIWVYVVIGASDSSEYMLLSVSLTHLSICCYRCVWRIWVYVVIGASDSSEYMSLLVRLTHLSILFESSHPGVLMYHVSRMFKYCVECSVRHLSSVWHWNKCVSQYFGDKIVGHQQATEWLLYAVAYFLKKYFFCCVPQ